MLRWTAAGAVADPTTVQIRVSPAFPGRVGVGAPMPLRALSVAEVADNVRWFTVTRRGPRTPACTALVLSGIADFAPLLPIVRQARAEGLARLTLHCGADLQLAHSDLAAEADAVVLSIASVGDAEAAAVLPGATQAVVLLRAEVLPVLSRVVQALCAWRPQRVVLTWPFPGGEDAHPPSAAAVAGPAREALRALDAAGIPSGVKGLPLCALAPGQAAARWSERVWRSPNRWYVDADHQQRDALIFFPDVVRFAKRDNCRFCAANRRCDGVVEPWLRLGLAGPLLPLAPFDR